MNTRTHVRLRLAVAAGTALLLMLLAGLMWSSAQVSPQPTAHAVGHDRQGAARAVDPGTGGGESGQGTSLQEVAGRDHERKYPSEPQGVSLEEAAGRDHERKYPSEPQGASLRDVANEQGQGPDRRSPGSRDRTEGLSERRDIRPEEVLDAASRRGPGGCLPQYGEDGQCLPAVPPSMAKHVQDMRDSGLDPRTMDHRWTCAEVRKYFPDGIKVRSADKDPQRLDASKDGVACGPGD